MRTAILLAVVGCALQTDLPRGTKLVEKIHWFTIQYLTHVTLATDVSVNRVAKRLGMSAIHVRNVAQGVKRSAKVTAALLAETRQMH